MFKIGIILSFRFQIITIIRVNTYNFGSMYCQIEEPARCYQAWSFYDQEKSIRTWEMVWWSWIGIQFTHYLDEQKNLRRLNFSPPGTIPAVRREKMGVSTPAQQHGTTSQESTSRGTTTWSWNLKATMLVTLSIPWTPPDLRGKTGKTAPHGKAPDGSSRDSATARSGSAPTSQLRLRMIIAWKSVMIGTCHVGCSRSLNPST
jgi:hypothetical protein